MARTLAVKTFGDCTTHGQAIENVFRSTLDNGEVADMCGLCAKTRRTRDDGAPSFVKVVMTNVRKVALVDRGNGAKQGECKGACLAGKRSCDCKCAGRCHGMGVCLGGHA